MPAVNGNITDECSSLQLLLLFCTSKLRVCADYLLVIAVALVLSSANVVSLAASAVD